MTNVSAPGPVSPHANRTKGEQQTDSQAAIARAEAQRQEGLGKTEQAEAPAKFLGRTQDNTDFGAAARERLMAKQKRMRIASTIRLFVLGFLVIFLLGAGGFGYYQWDNRLVARTTDTRSCTVSFGNSEERITGTRTFSYQFTEIMGYQFRDNSKVDEKTSIDVNGTPMTIIAMTGRQYEPIHVGMGEKGKQVIPKADMYAFTVDNKRTVMVEYRAFCR